MKISAINGSGVEIAVVNSSRTLLCDARSALDLLIQVIKP
jgi:hypothetical protein